MVDKAVLFVHGIGASARVWKRFDLPGRKFFYLSFSNCFDHPRNQVAQLKSEIDQILKIEGHEKVVLICHSLGGLVARKYLADHPFNHHIEKLILFSTPNLGSIALSFNWLPAFLILIGFALLKWIWPLFLVFVGLFLEVISYFRGVLLLSPAVWAMRPNSRFLRELNAQRMPTDVKYVAVLSDAKNFPHNAVNTFILREGGDGAIPLHSQKLSLKSVPNFQELDYSEFQINTAHFEIPRKAQEAISQVLEQ